MENSYLSFKNYLLQEDLVTFGKKAYPKYGNVVILAGGAGSGKGFVIKNLLGIEAKVLDPDQIKSHALKSKQHIKNAIEKFSSIKNFNLKNPEHTSELHTAMHRAGIEHKQKTVLQNSLKNSSQLPNLIIDTTLSNFDKFEKVCDFVKSIGYLDTNIHLVWVINDFRAAKENNLTRERTVSDEVLKDTHAGAAKTLSRIYSLSNRVKEYLDGDIWYVFNKNDTDSTIVKSNTGKKVLTKATYFKVKEARSQKIKVIPSDLLDKISSYTKVE